MAQDSLVTGRVESEDRRRFGCEIDVSYLNERAKGIGCEIRAEHERSGLGTHVERINCDIRAAVERGLHLVDDVFGIESRRPPAGELAAREWIDELKRALDIKKTNDMFTFD